MKKAVTTLLITIALISTACSSEKTTNQNVNKNIRKENINVTRNDEGTYTSFNGKRTNAQGVIIGEAVDENGIMTDCAMGSTGQQIGLPSTLNPSKLAYQAPSIPVSWLTRHFKSQ